MEMMLFEKVDTGVMHVGSVFIIVAYIFGWGQRGVYYV
jgi:hypothetical protein